MLDVILIISVSPLSLVISIVPPVRSNFCPYKYFTLFGNVFITILFVKSWTVIPNVFVYPWYETVRVLAPILVLSNPVIIALVIATGDVAVPLAITALTVPPLKSIVSFNLYTSFVGSTISISFT